MNKERLLKLAEFLGTVPENRFDLGFWRRGVDKNYLVKEMDCKTSGCAIGWACSMPEFIEAGLYFHEGEPHFDVHSGWYAVTNFFDLKYNQVTALFDGGNYIGEAKPVDVAIRIHKIVAGRDIEQEAEDAYERNYK